MLQEGNENQVVKKPKKSFIPTIAFKKRPFKPTKVLSTKGFHSMVEGVNDKGDVIVCRKPNSNIPANLFK